MFFPHIHISTYTVRFDLDMTSALKCVKCGELFSDNHNLSRHLKIHNPNSWSHCQFCTFTTKRNDSLKRHSNKYHMANRNGAKSSAIKSISIGQYPHSIISPKGPDIISSSGPLNTEQMATLNNHTAEFDKRLQLPNYFVYAGSTQSGKTTLLMKTLQNAEKFYRPVPTRVYFLHNCFQENYEMLRKNLLSQNIQIEFIKRSTISEADLKDMSDSNGGQSLIIIDDNSISAASSKEVAQVFTIARHKNCSIILLLHFIFGPWPSSRIISANTSYFFLLKSPRMTHQVSTLGSQLGKQIQLVTAYTEASRIPYGYVLLDLCTNTPDSFRIRNDILVAEEQQDELSQIDSLMSKNGLKIGEAPLHGKAPKTVTPQLEKKWLWCSHPVKNSVIKRTKRKQKKKRSRKVSTRSFIPNSPVPFANMYRPYI